MSKPTIEDRLAKLGELSDDELASLETEIQSAFDDAEESGDLERMDSMVTALEDVYAARNEADEDASTPDEEEQPAEEPEEPSEDTETKTTEESEEATEDGNSNDETKTETKVETNAPDVEVKVDTEATDTIEEEKLPMAASADFQPPEDAQPVVASASTAIMAGADISGFSAGTQFDSLDEVSRAFVSRLNSIKRSGRGGDGEQLSVATVVASIPEDRMLVPGDVEGNSNRIEAVTGEQAIVASGGYCAPLAVKYDIFGLGSVARPIRDGLPAFGATRGGIRFVQPPVLTDYADAVSLWTAANDRNPATDATSGDVIPKPCLTVDCAAEVTAETDAVTLCLVFGNLMSRAYPELVQRHNQLALVQHARFAELNLLNQIGAESLAVTSAFKLGTARDFLFSIAKAGAAYRNRHRVGRTTPLRVIAPEWVLDAMREDVAQQLPGDSTLAMADAVITAFLAARNVNVTWHMDDTFPAQAAGALVDFPATIKWYIFAEGTFLFLDGGTLDLGVVRDSELVGTNDYKTFVETFEGVAKVGIESVEVTTTTHVTGATTGTVAPV